MAINKWIYKKNCRNHLTELKLNTVNKRISELAHDVEEFTQNVA